MSSKILNEVKSMTQRLKELQKEGCVNGNFSTDRLIELYEASNELDDESSNFRKGTVKKEAINRARKEGYRNEKGQLVLQGDTRSGLGYAYSSSSVNNDIVKEEIIKKFDDVEEAMDFVFDLMKSSGLSVTSTRKQVKQGILTEDTLDESEPNHEDFSNVFRPQDERFEESELTRKPEPVHS